MMKSHHLRALRGAGLVLGLALLAAGAAAAQSWDLGGAVDSATTLMNRGAADWQNQDKLSLWVSADLGAALVLDAQGSYTYALDRPYLFDVDRLALAGTYRLGSGGGTVLDFTVGRFPLLDLTGDVLDMSADGLQVRLGLPGMQLGLAAAYTGLLLKPVAALALSAADSADAGNADIVLAPGRLLVQAEMRLPELFARQTVVLALLLQQDLRSQESQRLDSQYLVAGLSGPVVPGLYYDASFTFSAREDHAAGDTLLSWLAKGGVRYFAPQLLNTRLALDARLASGDSGAFQPFLPVNAPTLGLVVTPPLGDLLQAQASWSIKPLARSASFALRNLQTELRGTVYLLSATQEYEGSEAVAVISFRPLSDLGAALSGGVWLPKGGDPQYGGKLEASLAF